METKDTDNSEDKLRAKIELENSFSSGVSWFLWIAILSVINSFLVQNESDFFMIFGLGASAFIDLISLGLKEDGVENLNFFGRMLSMGIFSLIPPLVFYLFYKFSKKLNKKLYKIGMILYSLDALVFLYIQDYLSFGFHIYALFSMYSGLAALNNLQKLNLGLIEIDTSKDTFGLKKEPTQFSYKQSLLIILSIIGGITLLIFILQYFVDN